MSDKDAIAACHAVHDSVGIGVGGSSGAVVAACARYLAAHPEVRRAVCVCADGRSHYLNSLYSDAWLVGHGFCPANDSAALSFDDCMMVA